MSNVESLYQVYTALRLHFTQDSDNFDIRKGRIPKKPKQGVKKEFGIYLNKIKSKYNSQDAFVEYFVANFITGDTWGGLFDDGGANTYLEWQKRIQSMAYTYESELQRIQEHYPVLSELWEVENTHPPILKLYYGKIVSLETLVILNKLYKFRLYLDKKLFLDPVWAEVSIKIKKYSPFLTVEKDKYQMITKKVYNE